MEPNFLMTLTGIAMLLGILFCIPPISVYLKQKPVKTFGLVLFASGFLLITSFKWTEMAIKIGKYEVTIANAEQTINDLTERNIEYYAALSEANDQIASTNQTLTVALGNSGETSEEWMQTIASKINSRVKAAQVAGNPPSESDYITFITQTLDEQGLSIVSTKAVSETVHEIDSWQEGWSDLNKPLLTPYLEYPLKP